MSMQIRRDDSNLYFGKKSRRGGGMIAFVVIWIMSLALALAIVWRFNAVQARVQGLVTGQSSPTPSGVNVAEQAQSAYWEGNLDRSIELYAEAARLEPNNMGIQFEYVRNLLYGSYAGRGYVFRAEIALEVSEKLVKDHPQDPQALAAYAFALIENRRADEGAAAALSAVEFSNELWAEPMAYLSLAYRDQGRWRLAQEQAEEAVQVNPMSLDARRALALSLAFTGEYQVAIDQYEQAIQVHPRLAALYFELAPYYIVQENYDAAIQAYDRVLANDPRNVKAWTRKCETYFRQRDDANAQEACEQAISLDETFPEAHRQLGMVRYTRRNYEGSVESFDTCIKLMEAQNWRMEDRLTQCYYLQGLAYYYLGDCTKAQPLFDIALFELTTMSEVEQGIALQGVDFCGNSSSIPPTPMPTAIPPTPIGIY